MNLAWHSSLHIALEYKGVKEDITILYSAIVLQTRAETQQAIAYSDSFRLTSQLQSVSQLVSQVSQSVSEQMSQSVSQSVS